MEKVIKLYNYVDGKKDTPFPSKEEQVVIFNFEYNANRMGSAPFISAKAMHRLCLDDLWNDKVYALYEGVKFFVMNTPSSTKSNTDERYEHDIQLLSEREILNHIYFIDAAINTADTQVSNSTKFQFMGNISQFVSRLNASLTYSGVDYTAIVDSGIESENKLISFDNKYIMEALQEAFNAYEIPYYFKGKVIHFGLAEDTLGEVLKYGYDNALMSVSKNNANYKVINRISGMGSEDNIPYYYPNDSDDRKAIEASGGKWITPSKSLMPSIYRESFGKERFYNALNDTYPTSEGGYYIFNNPYTQGNPKEHMVNFPEIRPTIEGTTNNAEQRIDMFSEFAYDKDDNDEKDEQGNYLHPYFFGKLRKTDGAFGFNLFDQANEKEPMLVSMTSGVCGACKFQIGVGQSTDKNTVQVDDSGNLLRDEKGDVRCGREGKPKEIPQEKQNNTQNYEVWIALKKDTETFTAFEIMPNASKNLRPSANDTFVLLGITMPKGYILQAEKKLTDSLIKYMFMNNDEKFNFSVRFSRIYFAEHPEALEYINENSRILLEYNGKNYPLYIDSFSYKMDGGSPLPEIEVNLTDTITIGQNSLQNAIDSVKRDILSSIGGDFLKQGLKYFIRKDIPDYAKFLIRFLGGINVGNFVEGMISGSGAGISPSGNAEFEGLKVRSSLIVKELLYNRWRAEEGNSTFSESGVIERVEDNKDGTYNLYLRKRWEGDITAFAESDVCFGSVNNLNKINEYYDSWFRVISVNLSSNMLKVLLYPDEETPAKKNYIPTIGMVITRRGNASEENTSRHSFWYISSSEGCICMLDGVKKPIIEEENYSIIIGKLKHLSIFTNLPINYLQSYVYCRGIATQDVMEVDVKGVPKRTENFRGLWSREVAESSEPYRSTKTNHDTVSHIGCEWMCLVDKTKDEPKYNSTGWLMVRGNPEFTVDIDSTNGWSFDYDRIHQMNEYGEYLPFTTLNMTGKLYNQDVTDSILDSDIGWTRDTGYPDEDQAWAASKGSEKKSISISLEDLGSHYMERTACSFKVTAYLRDGRQIKLAEDMVTF